MNGVWGIAVEMSLERIFFQALFEGSSYHTSSIPIMSVLKLVPIHMLQLLAVCDAVACDILTLLKLKMPMLSLAVSLSPSLSLPSLRGCLKLPSLTLFTFSLFYRYREEMA